jgi:hypothetical protein
MEESVEPPEKSAPPLYALHTVGGVTLASFLGGPLAGSVLIAINERRLGRPEVARNAVLLGALGTAALFGLGAVLPDAATKGLPIGSIIGMRQIALGLFGPRLEEHKKAGGKLVSLWHAAGVGLIGAVAEVAVVLAVVFSMPAPQLKHMRSGDGEILYTEDVSEADAAAVAKVLERTGYFTGGVRQAGLVRNAPDTLALKCFVNEGGENNVDLVKDLESLEREVLTPELPRTKIVIELCDLEGHVKKTVR